MPSGESCKTYYVKNKVLSLSKAVCAYNAHKKIWKVMCQLVKNGPSRGVEVDRRKVEL
jgi:hypothetical protein